MLVDDPAPLIVIAFVPVPVPALKIVAGAEVPMPTLPELSTVRRSIALVLIATLPVPEAENNPTPRAANLYSGFAALPAPLAT